MLKFIIVFTLIISIIRVFREAVRFGICLYRVRPFKSDWIENTITALATSFIITTIICGIPT